jgi:hypothetical protein
MSLCSWLVVPRAIDALTFAGSISPARGLCLEGGFSVALAQAHLGIAWSTAEERAGGHRRPWRTEELATLIGLLPGEGRILSYTPAVPDSLLRRLLGTPSFGSSLADKIAFRRIVSGLGVRVPRHIVFYGAPDHELAATSLGTPYVLQIPDGSAGHGTYVVYDRAEVATALAHHPEQVRWLASQHREGPVMNVHAIVRADGTVQPHAASVGLTGRTGLAPSPGAYCGSDFAATRAIPPTRLRELHVAALTIGGWLAEQGWRGMFGLDAIVDEQGAWLLEGNIRQQASSWLLAELERLEGHVGLGECHLHAVTGMCSLPAPPPAPLNAATIVVRAQRPHTAGSLRPGIYRVDGRGLLYRRDGYGIVDLSQEEVFIDGPPIPGAPVDEGAVLARIATRRQVLNDELTGLNSYAAMLVSATKAALEWPSTHGIEHQPLLTPS